MQRIAVAGLAVLLQVFFQLAGQPLFLVAGHPFDLLRAIRQVAQHRPGQQDCRHADDDEQPLPAIQPQHSVHAQQAAGHRAGDHHGDGLREDEQAQDLAAVANRKPLGDVVQNTRKEARLCNAEQKAHHVETVRPLNKGHANGNRAPGQHDPGKPAPCAETLQHQVAGDLHQEVADKEQPRTQAVGRIANADVCAHMQLGEAHGRPV